MLPTEISWVRTYQANVEREQKKVKLMVRDNHTAIDDRPIYTKFMLQKVLHTFISPHGIVYGLDLKYTNFMLTKADTGYKSYC